jgi:VIT1/CCC1 family predicted Fe2+/Mn2+ transporter
MMREPGRKDQPLNGRRGSIRSIEPWYSVYALLGALVAGLIPILLPLLTSTGGNAAVAGLVIAAVSLGG